MSVTYEVTPAHWEVERAAFDSDLLATRLREGWEPFASDNYFVLLRKYTGRTAEVEADQ